MSVLTILHYRFVLSPHFAGLCLCLFGKQVFVVQDSCIHIRNKGTSKVPKTTLFVINNPTPFVKNLDQHTLRTVSSQTMFVPW